MKKKFTNFLNRTERGQAIVLVAFAIVGIIAMVGLVTDTGMLLIHYGQLKRGVDAAAVAAAQQYRVQGNASDLDPVALAGTAKNFLDLNQAQNVTIDYIHTCADVDPNRPALCNQDPDNFPEDNRKLVEVKASAVVNFGFLSVIGIKSTTISSIAIGEAAALDLILVIDTSASMAYETGNELGIGGDGSNSYITSDSDDNPKVCNFPTDTCEPMKSVKTVAKQFVNTLYFPYDRVAIITTTGQSAANSNGSDYNTVRAPIQMLALTTVKQDVIDAIDEITVFEPRDCEPADNPGFVARPGACLLYIPDQAGNLVWDNATRTITSGTFNHGSYCQIYEIKASEWDADPSSCPSSNYGGALKLAKNALTDPAVRKLESFWVVLGIFGGAANATDIDLPDYPNGYCPEDTYQTFPQCRDRKPSERHYPTTAKEPWQNPIPLDPNVPGVLPPPQMVYPYDADDFARYQADKLATLVSGDGVTIYTIGLGKGVISTGSVDTGEDPAAESLLEYIAECAGEGLEVCPDPFPDPVINHGQYFYSPNTAGLSDIFNLIANNIATKISQ